MAQPTVKEIVDFIYSGTMTSADREHICDALRDQQKTAQHRAALAFRPGSLVQFTSSRQGRLVRGTVTKVNRTTVQVFDNEQHVTWKVSPSLLRAQ